MSGTPLFLITDAGLAAASVATPTGPYIHITGFEIGSAYGYTPQETDTGINGNLLFSGVPTSYEYIGNNTLNIICEIPPDAGPWQFGEVALFLPGNVMFAKAVFATPQEKFSSLGTNVVSSYTLNCLLQLAQSVAVFQIDTINAPPGVVDIYQWSDVYPPGVSANPDVPLYVVRELDERGDSTLLQNSTDANWSVGTSYNNYQTAQGASKFTVTNSSTSWVQVAASACHPADLTAPNRRFLVQTPDGFFRSVNNVVASGSNYQFNLNVTNDGTYSNSPLLNAPTVGSQVRIYRDDQAGGSIYYSQIIDPPTIPTPPTASPGTPGLAYGGSGTIMPGGGAIDVFGLLHGTTSSGAQGGAGRLVTASDNMNTLSFPSGLYASSVGSYGLPANWPPVDWDGIMAIVNNGTITQTYYPEGMGGGDSQGNGGVPIYYRSYDNSQSAWSAWFPVLMNGKLGASGLWTTSNVQLLTVGGIGTYTFGGAEVPGSGSFTRGQVVTLPGAPGSWTCMSLGATGSDGRDWLYLRTA